MTLRFLAVAWLAGAAVGALGFGVWWPAILLSGIKVAIGWLLEGRRQPALLLMLVLLAGLASFYRYELALPPTQPEGIAAFDNEEAVRLLGTIATEPEERVASQRFEVDVAAVSIGSKRQETTGRVLVTARPFPRHNYGEIVEMEAMLETPPVLDGFDYGEYLARKGIVFTALFPAMTVHGVGGGNGLKKLLIDTRAPLGTALKRTLPEPEAALAQGILLGQRASIPEDVNSAFNDAGISHLIAISGYNVMLVSGAVIGAFTPFFGRRQAFVVAIVAVLVYAAFVGGSPPVLRAALMALVMLGATLAGRPGSALTGVTLAGAALVLWQPLIIEDVSFQLSFGATAGIVVAARPLQERLMALLSPLLPSELATFLASQVAVTTAATLAVAPILAVSFGRLSLVSLPANVVASLLFNFAFLGSLIVAAAGAVDVSLGRATAEFAYWPLHGLVLVAEVASSLPLAAVSVNGVWIWIATGVAAVPVVILLRPREEASEAVERGPVPRLRPAALLAVGSALAAAAVWWGVLQPSENRLRVSVLDVGQGDAILIESPSGGRVLIDGGPSGALITQALGNVLAPSERRIDLMVLTHAQDDHLTGLVEVLERFEVGNVLWSGQPGETGAFEAWVAAVSAKGVPVMVASAGQAIDLGSGAFLEVLHPQQRLLQGTEDDLNNNAVVLRLVYGDVSFLLTGDIEVDGEAAILKAGHEVGATVLKVAHHGSAGATTQQFLEAVAPSIAVISAGAGNSFGHPSPSLRLRLAGLPVLRTDLNGTVKLETDGRQLWLESERGEVVVVDPALAP